MLFFPQKSNPYLQDPDVLFMMAFIQGDQKSFETIMGRNYQRIFSFISRMISDYTQAEDLTQDVFLKLYAMKSSYQPRSKLSTLLFQIARNAALNYLRDQKQHVSIDEHLEQEESSVPRQIQECSILSPQESLENQELALQIRKAIDALPENQRVAVLLRRFEEMSYEEIAQTMKTTPKAVKSLLNRAKDNLRELLKENF